MKKLFTIYDLDYNVLAQFDDYSNLANYIGTTIDCVQCYFSKKKKNIAKTIIVKDTNKKVFMERDYIYE